MSINQNILSISTVSHIEISNEALVTKNYNEMLEMHVDMKLNHYNVRLRQWIFIYIAEIKVKLNVFAIVKRLL